MKKIFILGLAFLLGSSLLSAKAEEELTSEFRFGSKSYVFRGDNKYPQTSAIYAYSAYYRKPTFSQYEYKWGRNGNDDEFVKYPAALFISRNNNALNHTLRLTVRRKSTGETTGTTIKPFSFEFDKIPDTTSTITYEEPNSNGTQRVKFVANASTEPVHNGYSYKWYIRFTGHITSFDDGPSITKLKPTGELLCTTELTVYDAKENIQAKRVKFYNNLGPLCTQDDGNVSNEISLLPPPDYVQGDQEENIEETILNSRDGETIRLKYDVNAFSEYLKIIDGI